MAVSCVRTESQEFKDKAKALNITEGQLENILHEYYNSEELQNSFAEDEFINTKLNGISLDTSSEIIHQAWENAYSQPLVFDNVDDYKRALESARNIFGRDAVGITESPDGKYTIRVAEPRENSDMYFQKNPSAQRERNLEIVKRFYAGVVYNVVRERRALAEQKRKEYNDKVYVRADIDSTGALQRAEANSALKAFKDRYGSIADAYLYTLPNGNIKLVVKPLSEEILERRALAVLDRMSDEELISEVQRLEQEYGNGEESLFYINPKKLEDIKVQIAKKNPLYNEGEIKDSLEVLSELEENQENNLFVQTAIRWLKNATISLPRDLEKVQEVFKMARKYGIDVQKAKSPLDLQFQVFKKNKKELEAGEVIAPSSYKELSYDKTVTTEDGKQIVIYNVENTERGQQAVVDILAKASPKLNGEPSSSPWCLSTFNYNKETKVATPTLSARNFWEHYSLGKRQIAFVNGRPVAFNSSAYAQEESWWDFNDRQAFEDITAIDFSSPSKFYELNNTNSEYFTFDSGIYQYWGVGNVVTGVAARINGDISIDADLQNGSSIGITADGLGNFRFEYDNSDSETIYRVIFTPEPISIDSRVVHFYPHFSDSSDGITLLSDSRISASYFKLGEPKSIRDFVSTKLEEKFSGIFSFANEIRQKMSDAFPNSINIYNLQELSALTELLNEFKTTYKNAANSLEEPVRLAIEDAKKEYKEQHGSEEQTVRTISEDTVKEVKTSIEEEILTDSWAPVRNTERNNRTEYDYNSEEEAKYAIKYGLEEVDRLEELSRKRFSIRDILQALNFGREKSYADAYNERVVKPLNEELATKLHDLLRSWNFEVVFDNLREVFGDDVLGALDVLEKVVYLSNNGDRNQITDAEEFSHAFIKLMGATYRKEHTRSKYPENRLYSELRDLIVETDLYQQTYDQYSKDPHYLYKNGEVNKAKIAEEALGKALAVTLNERYEARTEAEKSFLAKVKQWFDKVLLWFKSKVNKNGRLEKELNDMADSIFRGDYLGKYLPEAPVGQSLVSWEGTLEDDAREGGHGLELIRLFGRYGGIVTGSMSYRAQGMVWRTESDSLHDLDFAFNASNTLFARNPELRSPYSAMNLDNSEIVRMVQEDETVQNISNQQNIHFLHAFPVTKYDGTSQIIVTFMRTENSELADRFRDLSGSYKERLSNFTDEERRQIYLIDCFFEQSPIESSTEMLPTSTEDYLNTEEFEIAGYKESFKAKLKMGRAKDLIDYRLWRPYTRRFKTSGNRDIMLQKSSEQSIDYAQTQSQTETPLIVTGQNIRRENQRFLKNQWSFTDGFYALYDNGVGLTQSEVTAEARQLSYWLSDKITELQQNPESVYNEFGLEKKNGWTTEKDKNDDIDAISRMSRRDLVSKVGIVNLKNLYQKEVLNGNALDNLKGRDRKKVNLLSENVSTLFELGLATFSNNEGYKIVHNSELDTYETADYYGDESIAEDGIIDIAELAEQGTNLEDWMVDKSTIEVLGTASAIVRSALSQCFILDEKGEVKKDYLGRPERVGQNDAVKSIVRWTQGSQSIRDMISKLSAKSNNNPWITQILKRLQDESGLEADFISQFYTTFQKHFQLFDIVKRNNDKKYYFMDVNNRPALNNAVNEVIAAFSINESPLFTTVGFNQTEIDKFRATVVRLSNNLNVTEESFNKYKDGYVDRFVKLSEMLGYSISKENVATSLNYNNFRDAIIALSNMLDRFEAERNNTGTYRPFEYSRDTRANSVLGYLRDFLRVITESVEDTTESSFYESGKMRQSYQIPSYATKLFGQLTGDAELFNTTLDTEFAPYEWFMTQTARGKRRWRNYMLAALEGMDEKTRKQVLSHKRNLNFMGDQYMRGMSPERYALSVLTEFGRSRNVNGMQISYYRFPIQSNKASSDFLSFIRFTGVDAKTTMLDHFMKVFGQELSRIQTVIKRDRKKGDVDYIANFDGERGRKFCFLDFMNNPESIVSGIFSKEDAVRLKELIQEKIEGKESAENNVGELESLARNAIESFLNLETLRAIQSYSELGVMDAIRNIDGVIDENINVSYREQAERFIENFVWNDTLAAIGMTQLLVTDLAFYENSDDFQKRFAQVHSPGTRGNRFATDYNGVRVSDGNIRNVFLNDFETYKTNMMENLSIILDRNIAQAPEDSRAAYTALKENILDRMSKINVTDGQALTSPTSMRKKGFMFGQWSRDAERAYDRIKSGKYTMRDLEIAFNVKKPFTYSQLSQNVASEGTPLSKIKVPTQVKDSEYMLVMAGALLNNTETGKPNLLRVLYEVMEDSAFDGDDTTGKTQNGRGIDAFVFNSAVKSGLTGSSNIVNDWYNGKFKGTNAEIEAKLKESLLGELYAKKQDGSIDFSKYNEFTVKSIPVEDYALQTEVPLHMIDEKVIWGSQMRAILESNLAYVDYEGNPVEFSWTDSKGEQHTANRDKFKKAYENKAAKIVNLCANELYDELGLGGDLVNSRIAVAKKLQEEIKNNYERYGLDLLLSCSIDKNGKFRLPLGDPTISKRVEQLVNSVVKNRLNKPKVAGGMAVQVSNIGTSRQLNFRFFDKQGNLLPTREEWLKANPSRTNEDYLEFCRENQGGFAYEENYAPAHMRDMFNLFTDENGNVDIESIEMLDDNLLFSIDQRTPTEFYYSISVSKTIDFLPQEAGDGYMRPYEITEKDDSDFDVDKDSKWKLKASIKRKKGVHIKPMDLINLVPELKAMRLGDAMRAATKFLYSKDKLKNSNTLDKKEWSNPELFRAIKRAWIKESYEVVYPTEGINAMLNDMWRMSKAVLQHESNAAKILSPGGNAELTRVGYIREVMNKTGRTYDDVSTLSDKELKSIVKAKDLNTMSFLNQLEYYQRNNDASSNLGIFAVAATSHNLLEGQGYGLANEAEFTIAGKTYGNFVEFDVTYDDDGMLVSKSLGANVSGAADAAKVPSHGYLNINNSTINEYLVLLRTGMPMERAALFISSTPLKELVSKFNAANVERFTKKFDKIISEEIESIKEKVNLSDDSSQFSEELTWEEIKRAQEDNVPDEIRLKVLLTFQRLSALTEGMRMLTAATRYNSVASAVGPEIIDNILFENQIEGYRLNVDSPIAYKKESYYVDGEGNEVIYGDKVKDARGNLVVLTPDNASRLRDSFLIEETDNLSPVGFNEILKDHPMLKAFSRGYTIADDVFKNVLNMPLAKNGFNSIITYPKYASAFKNRDLLNKFSNFYLSYLLVASGVVNSSDTMHYIREFPEEFLKKRNNYKGNKLVGSVKPKVTDGVISLELSTTGMRVDDRSDLQSAWADLYKKDKEFALDLFRYNFFKGGLGFSPKTFMNLLPIQIRENIDGYAKAFSDTPNVSSENVVDQFFRNNAHDNNIVRNYKLEDLQSFGAEYNEKTHSLTFRGDGYERMKNSPFFRFKDANNVTFIYKIATSDSNKKISVFYITTPLGNNGEFLEMSSNSIIQSAVRADVIDGNTDNATTDSVPDSVVDASERMSAPKTDEQIRKEAEEYASAFKEAGGEWLSDNYEKLITFATNVKRGNRQIIPEVQRTKLKAFFERMGIPYNEDKINDIVKKLCS